MLLTTRRQILKAMAAAGFAAPLLPLGLRRLAFAAEPSAAPLLIVIHLRGGCDGLNFISPATDPDFIASRTTELRVTADGKDAGYALANAPQPQIDFRLHNAAGGMNELYKEGNLAFIHACGLTDATRSHFVATDMIDRGVGTGKELARTQSGWLTRAIGGEDKRGGVAIDAVALSGTVTGDLDGLDRVLTIPDLNNGLPVIGGAGAASVLWDLYETETGPLGEAGRLALQLPIVIDQRIERDPTNHVMPYRPDNNASYDSAGGFGNTLKALARLIKMDIGLRAVTLDYGSWDTHEYQAGRIKGLIEPLSNGIASFWNDVTAYKDRLTIVTVTEFGRRLRSNRSGGTDHGRASLMSVLGGRVRGGRFYGAWPGLTSAQLDEGVDLAVTTDYRRVLTETLDHMTGQKNAGIFPAYDYPGAMGLFG